MSKNKPLAADPEYAEKRIRFLAGFEPEAKEWLANKGVQFDQIAEFWTELCAQIAAEGVLKLSSESKAKEHCFSKLQLLLLKRFLVTFQEEALKRLKSLGVPIYAIGDFWQDFCQYLLTRKDFEYRSEGETRSYCLRKLRFAFISKLRRDAALRQRVREYSRTKPNYVLPSSTIEDSEMKHGLRDCLGKLPQQYREIVELRIWHQHTHTEVANQVGLSCASALRWFKTALNLLRDCLEKKGLGDT